MRRLLITGGAGFIGANLVRFVRARNLPISITVLDNESAGDRAALTGLDVDFVQGDIRDETLLRSVLIGHDTVLHLAADAGVIGSTVEPAKNFSTNVVGTFRLLEACRSREVTRVVAASTSGALFGDGLSAMDETSVMQPLSPYGASKLAMEGYLSAFAGSYCLSTLALRFTNIYGPGSFHKESVVACFCRALLDGDDLTVRGDGRQLRDFLFVDDLVEGIWNALLSTETGVIVLGSGQPTSLNKLLDTLFEVAGRRDFTIHRRDVFPGEVHSCWSDISKAREKLGFCPKTDLMDGLRVTLDWFRHNAPSFSDSRTGTV